MVDAKFKYMRVFPAQYCGRILYFYTCSLKLLKTRAQYNILLYYTLVRVYIVY